MSPAAIAAARTRQRECADVALESWEEAQVALDAHGGCPPRCQRHLAATAYISEADDAD